MKLVEADRYGQIYDIIHFTLVLFQGFEVGLTVGVLWSAGSIPASGDDTPDKLRYSTYISVDRTSFERYRTVTYRTVRYRYRSVKWSTENI